MYLKKLADSLEMHADRALRKGRQFLMVWNHRAFGGTYRQVDGPVPSRH